MSDRLFPDLDELPIAEAPRDGTTCLVRRGADYAAAHWSTAFGQGHWMFGHVEDDFRMSLEFEPTHWLRPRAKAAA